MFASDLEWMVISQYKDVMSVGSADSRQTKDF